MVDAATYHEVIDEVVAFIERTFPDAVVALYLGGSVARGDFIPGRSDIDLYAVLTDRDETVETTIREHLATLEGEYLTPLQAIDPDPLSIAFTSVAELEAGRSFLGQGFEYEPFQADAAIIYGSDIRDDIEAPSRAAVVESADAALRGVEQEFDHAHDRMTKELFTLVFRTVCIYQGGHGRPVGAKDEAVALSREHIDDEALVSDVERALELYDRWGARALDLDEFCELVRIYHRVVPRLIERWQTEMG